jgi:hypothetical protein
MHSSELVVDMAARVFVMAVVGPLLWLLSGFNRQEAGQHQPDW